LVGIPVSECLVRIGFHRRTGGRRFIRRDRLDNAVVLRMGIDIAVRAPHQASLADEKGELLWSAHRFRTTVGDLEKLWARLPRGHTPNEVTIVMEPTRNAWVPLAAWFRRRGAHVVLVSAERCPCAVSGDAWRFRFKTSLTDSVGVGFGFTRCSGGGDRP
jgi:hypothetical protein